MAEKIYRCLICEKLKKRKSKYAPKFIWFMTYDSEEEVIRHIRKEHPNIYNKTIKSKT